MLPIHQSYTSKITALCQNYKMNKIFFNPLTFGAVLLVASLVGLSLHQTGKKANTAQQQLEHLEKNLQDLKNAIAEKTIEASRSAEPFVKEKIARDQLLWQKPGEVVIELPATTPSPKAATTQPTQTPLQAWQEVLLSP